MDLNQTSSSSMRLSPRHGTGSAVLVLSRTVSAAAGQGHCSGLQPEVIDRAPDRGCERTRQYPAGGTRTPSALVAYPLRCS